LQCAEKREPALRNLYQPRKTEKKENLTTEKRKRKKKKKRKKEKEKRETKYHTILFHSVNRRIRVMKKWFHVFFKNRWGRGQPDDIGAINLGDEKFDPDSDKKPRAGQILWIRGLTRLQTQVTIPISLFLSLSLSLSSSSLFSLSLFLSISLSLSFSHSLIISSLSTRSIFSRFLSHEKQKETQQDRRHRIQQVRMAKPYEPHIRPS